MAETIVINLDIGASTSIDLTGRGPVGYSWVHDLAAADVVRISHQYIVPPNPVPGQRGIERFTFTGVGTGASVVNFRQIQSWEKDGAPLDQRTVHVNVA